MKKFEDKILISKERFKQTIILFLILFLISKEVIANDYEIVIIYCLLAFIIINYFLLKGKINNMLITIIKDLRQDYKQLIKAIELLENEIAKLLYLYKQIHFLTKRLYKLIYKYINLSVLYIKNNFIKYNIHVLKLNELKNKANLENRKKFNIFYLNKLINL